MSAETQAAGAVSSTSENGWLRRTLGWLGMIFGVLGIVVSLLLLVFVWVGHGAVAQTIDSLSGGTDAGLAQAQSQLSEVHTTLTDAQTSTQQFATQAQTLAGTTVSDLRRPGGLVDTFDQTIGAKYAHAREVYAGARERTTTLLQTAHRLDKVLPGVDLPDAPGDRLQTVDERLQQVDTTLTSLRSDIANASAPGSNIAQLAANVSNQLAGYIGTLASAIDDLKTRLDTARAQVQSASDTAQTWNTLAAVALSLLSLYGVLLHLSLFAHGRVWSRRAAPAPLPTAAKTV